MTNPLIKSDKELSFHVASGTSIDECAAIVNASPVGRFDPHDAISWFVERARTDEHVEHVVSGPQRGLYRSVWRSPTRETFVVLEPDLILWSRDWNEPVESFRMPFLVHAIGGTWDGEAHAFGVEVERNARRYVSSRFRGGTWEPPRPTPGDVLAIDGPDGDRIYAVGADGLLAYFDGNQWRQFRPVTSGSFAGLTVSEPDRGYACGWNGELYELSPYGCALLLDVPGFLLDVGELKGELYVAGRAEPDERDVGLYMFRQGTLERLDSPGPPRSIDDSGDRLLITTVEQLVDTDDGQTFRTFPLRELGDELSVENLPGS